MLWQHDLSNVKLCSGAFLDLGACGEFHRCCQVRHFFKVGQARAQGKVMVACLAQQLAEQLPGFAAQISDKALEGWADLSLVDLFDRQAMRGAGGGGAGSVPQSPHTPGSQFHLECLRPVHPRLAGSYLSPWPLCTRSATTHSRRRESSRWS